MKNLLGKIAVVRRIDNEYFFLLRKTVLDKSSNRNDKSRSRQDDGGYGTRA